MSSTLNTESRLSDNEHQKIYESSVRPELSSAEPVEKPKAILVAGQPGAGKSAISAQAIKELADHGGSVLIDPDDLRQLHPKYESYQQANNREASGMVHHDAAKWSTQLTDDAMKNSMNVIIDGTLRSPEAAEQLCKRLKSAGYEIDVRAMAVPAEDSKLSIHERYEGIKALGTPGRWVPMDYHEEAYSGIPKTLSHLNEAKLADNFQVHARSGELGKTQVIYNEKAGAGEPEKALNDERNRPKTPEEQHAHKVSTSRVLQHIQNRDPNLDEKENQEFVKSAHIKYPDINSKNQQSRQNEPSTKINPDNNASVTTTSPEKELKAAKALVQQTINKNGSALSTEMDRIKGEKAIDQEQRNIKKPSKGIDIH